VACQQPKWQLGTDKDPSLSLGMTSRQININQKDLNLLQSLLGMPSRQISTNKQGLKLVESDGRWIWISHCVNEGQSNLTSDMFGFSSANS